MKSVPEVYRGDVEAEDAATELRDLQKKAFGRGGKASSAELTRLADLQRNGNPSDTFEDVETRGEKIRGDAGESQERTSTTLPPDDRAPRRTMSLGKASVLAGGALLVGALASTLVNALNAGPSDEPAYEIPPGVISYDEKSVTYFGFVESVEIWTVSTEDGEERCIITFDHHRDDQAFATCLPADSERALTTAMSGLTAETARQYTIVTHGDGSQSLKYETVSVQSLTLSE